MKLGLGLIVRNEESDLPNCLRSMLPQVDAVAIFDTGSTDGTVEIAEKILKESGKLYHLSTYLDASDSEGQMADFSAARNQYTKQLETMGMDYIWSVDGDDILTHNGNLKKMIERNPADVYSIRYRLNPNFWFVSPKIWRTGLGIKWVGRVHEVIRFDWTKHKYVDLPFEVQHVSGHHTGQETGTVRNMRILKSEVYPALRSLFYWSNENVDAGNYEEAIKWYKEYIRRAKTEATWDVELAHCYFRAARWLQHLGRTDEALELSRELLARDSTWSESWCEMAYISKLKGDYESMRKYATKAKNNSFVSRLFSEQDKYTTVPTAMLKWLDDNKF